VQHEHEVFVREGRCLAVSKTSSLYEKEPIKVTGGRYSTAEQRCGRRAEAAESGWLFCGGP
jgi:hypothetical protein